MGNQIEKNEMGGTCSMCVREKRGVYRILVGKTEGKIPLGRPRHRWEDDIKMGWGGGAVLAGLIWLGIGTGGRHL